MSVRGLLYRWYSWWLKRQLRAAQAPPRHIGLVMDGNRRWARQEGFDSPSTGHQHGAEHLDDVLRWCADVGITHVTVFVISADNLRKRAPEEVELLMRAIEKGASERTGRPSGRWRIHVAGRLDALPDSTRHALKLAAESTGRLDTDHHLTVAVGYDGRDEIVDAVSALLIEESWTGTTPADLAARLTPDDIAAHLYTRGQPEPDLIIRTSGEVRMSGFLLWQAAFSELYFCDVHWPGFREVDFLRALRTYATRTWKS